jgi:membrane fusion protein, multidrug efflux system
MPNEDRQQPDQNQQHEDNNDQHTNDAEQHRAQDPRRKRTIRLVVLAVLVLAAVAAIPIYAYYSVRVSTDDAQIDGHVIPISARISGTIVTVLINDNQPVKAGQELIRLDPADYQVAVEQAQAQLATADASTAESQVNVPVTNINTSGQVRTSITQTDQSQAAVASAEQAVGASRGRLEASNAGLKQAQANYVKAQKDLGRYKDLVDRDEISKQEYDAAVANADASSAQVQSAKSDILSAQHTLDQSQAELERAKAARATALVQQRISEQIRPKQVQVSQARYKQAQALVKQRQAELDQARLNLSYTVIKAPVDGVVSRKSAEPGMHISAGQQFMSLIPLDDVWVTANFKETQLRHMHVGQQVEVEADTFGSSRQYKAHIDSIAGASGARFSLLPPENATGNYVKVVQRIPVKIVFDPGENRDRRLLPGMSVTPTVLVNSDTGQNQWQ